MFKVGVVKHYFDKVGIALVELGNILSVGEKIRFEKEGIEMFNQVVEVIQIEHKKIQNAGIGEIVGIKTIKPVLPGTEVFKV